MDLQLTNQTLLDVTHKFAFLAFRHYTDEEIGKLSLCNIKCECAFDELSRPVHNGLYELRLGRLTMVMVSVLHADWIISSALPIWPFTLGCLAS